MEDLCVLYADLESDHAGLVGGVCDHGRGGVAAVYERLYADDDFYGYAVHSGAFWRRVPKADARVSMRVARASASLLWSHGRVPGTSPV